MECCFFHEDPMADEPFWCPTCVRPSAWDNWGDTEKHLFDSTKESEAAFRTRMLEIWLEDE